MALEQTLFVCKEVDLYKIPPRPAAGGHRSGDWRVTDKFFTARCKVVAVGESLEVRLEDPNSGELFGVCPVPRGQLHIAVEAATDSSRNFVLRLEDAGSKRHAFIGMNFADRSAAFDFNVSLTDHERRLQREAEFSRIASAADPLAAAQEILPEAAAMYRHQDLSLKEGETIRIAVKKTGSNSGESSGSGGFLSRLGNLPQPSSSSASGSAAAKLMPLAPPPADLANAPRQVPVLGAAAPRAPAAAARPAADPFANVPVPAGSSGGTSSGAASRGAIGQSGPMTDLLELDNIFGPSGGSSTSSAAAVQSAVAAFDNFKPFAAAGTPAAAEQQTAQHQSPGAPQQPAAEPGWATFE